MEKQRVGKNSSGRTNSSPTKRSESDTPERHSFPKTSVELGEYELDELRAHFADLSDLQDSLGVGAGRALERINCLETLDSLAFIRADITYIRREIAAVNTTRCHIANVLRDIREVFDGLKDAEDEV